MSFALLFAGMVFGFVMSSVMFLQKIWDLRDRLYNEKYRAKFYKRELEKARQQTIEWKTVCGSFNRHMVNKQ